MMWTKEQIVELIEMLHSAPALWDISRREYRDRNLKYDEIAKMASHFDTNVDEISRKIKSLKAQYNRERKKIAGKCKSGAGAIPEDSLWFGYKMMGFISENNISKGSRATMEGNAEEESSQDDDEMNMTSPPTPEENPHFNNSDSIRPPPDASAPKKKRTTNNDGRVEEAYNFMRRIRDDVSSKDDFTVYGENVASRMRGANQNSRAVSIAKNRIDNILFQLEMGEFAHHRDAIQTNNSSQASPSLSSVSIPFSTSSPTPSPTTSTHPFHIPQHHSQSIAESQSHPLTITQDHQPFSLNLL